MMTRRHSNCVFNWSYNLMFWTEVTCKLKQKCGTRLTVWFTQRKYCWIQQYFFGIYIEESTINISYCSNLSVWYCIVIQKMQSCPLECLVILLSRHWLAGFRLCWHFFRFLIKYIRRSNMHIYKYNHPDKTSQCACFCSYFWVPFVGVKRR